MLFVSALCPQEATGAVTGPTNRVSERNIMPHLRAAHILAIPFAAMVATSACNTMAFADDLPPPSEPMLAERGDWAADFNQAQITCFKGSMSACDAIWLSKRVLQDTFLYNYGRTCGGRVSLGELRRAGAFRLGGPSLQLYGNLSRARMRRHCFDVAHASSASL